MCHIQNLHATLRLFLLPDHSRIRVLITYHTVTLDMPVLTIVYKAVHIMALLTGVSAVIGTCHHLNIVTVHIESYLHNITVVALILLGIAALLDTQRITIVNMTNYYSHQDIAYRCVFKTMQRSFTKMLHKI